MTLILTGILAILLVAGSTWLNNRLDHFLQQWETRQAETHARSLLESLKTLMLNGEGTLARQWMERMQEVSGILDVEVLRRDGRQAFTDLETVGAVNAYLNEPRFERRSFEPQRATPVNREAFETSLGGRMATEWDDPGRVTLYMPIPAQVECLACHGYDDDPLRGVLRLSMSTEEMLQWSAQLKRWSQGGIIALLVLLGLSMWLGVQWNVLVPLARFRDAILDFGERGGGRNLQLAYRRDDEIGEVAAAFNRLQARLRDFESYSEAITDNIPDVLVTTDERGIIVTANRAMRDVFGYAPDDLIGENVAILMPDALRDEHDGYIARYLERSERPGQESTRRQWEAMGRRRDDELFPVEVSLNEFALRGQRHFIAVIRDITDRKAQLAVIEHQALHDALTDLPNRTLFADRLQQGLRHSLRHHEPLVLMIMDLDRFKEINDTLGHGQGDLLLQQVASRLTAAVRESDTVARLGGDEFALLLPFAGEETAEWIARRLIREFERPFLLQGNSYTLGLSIGIALCPMHGAEESSLMRYADVAMYCAKRGRLGFAFYDAEQDPHSQYRLDLLNDLRRAVSRGELVLYYQPKVCLRTHQVVGVEGLVRWRHPQHGLIPPGEFMVHAERHGLTRALTGWVMDEALRQSERWGRDGMVLGMAINLSMHDLEDIDLVSRVRERHAGYVAEGPSVLLEITETAMMSNPPRVVQTLNELSEIGFSISIDDFGTGFSSLSYLRQLPLSEVKIDRSFVMDMMNNREAATIVRAIIDLAHNLGLRVVAEGVSDEKIYQQLQALGCDLAQGFHIARPMPAELLAEWLRSGFGNRS